MQFCQNQNRIRPGGGIGTRAGDDIRVSFAEQHAPDVRAATLIHAVFRNRKIQPELSQQRRAHKVEIHRVRKGDDVRRVDRAGCFSLVSRRNSGTIEQRFSVAFDFHNVCVRARDADKRRLFCVPACDANIQRQPVFHAGNTDLRGLQIGVDLPTLILRDAINHLKQFLAVPRNRACGCRGGDSFFAARTGNDDALCVLEDVPADANLHPFRQHTKRFS
ncbi:hypothetical protein SDC9_172981 [bioreactor metagenome]|uniref:Uncharacterized protein n=1 Tax=bioreactor metagenome TaxID=1076179 RepID=A0A645GIE8_9ZZZZ